MYLERKCKQQVSISKLKYQYKFTYLSNQGKLVNSNLASSSLLSSVVYAREFRGYSIFNARSIKCGMNEGKTFNAIFLTGHKII